MITPKEPPDKRIETAAVGFASGRILTRGLNNLPHRQAAKLKIGTQVAAMACGGGRTTKAT